MKPDIKVHRQRSMETDGRKCKDVQKVIIVMLITGTMLQVPFYNRPELLGESAVMYERGVQCRWSSSVESGVLHLICRIS